MTYRYYSLEQKIKFLDAYAEFGSLITAAEKTNVSESTSRYWVKKEKLLRDAYKQSSSLEKPVCTISRRTYPRLSLEEKIECIKEFERGVSSREIARQHSCGRSAVQHWYKRRDELLALYYTQHAVQDVEVPHSGPALTLSGTGEDEVSSDEPNKDLVKKIKAQEKEIKYLEDKITFLENLNKILQERSGPVKKKSFSKQSNTALNQEEET